MVRKRGSYLIGPLARYNLNSDRLPADMQRAGRRSAGWGRHAAIPFRSIIVRAVELVYACDEAMRLIAAYEPPDAPSVPIEPRAGVGHGATEAPRGMLYHRYALAEDGSIAVRPHRAADVAEPAQHRGGPVRRRNRRDRPADDELRTSASRRSATTTPAFPAPAISSSWTVHRA